MQQTFTQFSAHKLKKFNLKILNYFFAFNKPKQIKKYSKKLINKNIKSLVSNPTIKMKKKLMTRQS